MLFTRRCAAIMMQAASMLLVFASCSSALRRARSKKSDEPTASRNTDKIWERDTEVNSSQVLVGDADEETSDTQEYLSESCGSCSDLGSFLFQEASNLTSDIGSSDTAVGRVSQLCCRTRNRFSELPTAVMSASKMVSGYTMLRLVDEGLLSLDTKAADVFDFWTATDSRKDVTLRHVMSLTAGLTAYPAGFAQCTEGNSTRDCAEQAYNECFKSGAAPGEEFEYTESSYFVLSAMALEVTGLQHWDDVFQTYLAGPLGVDPLLCAYSFGSSDWAYAGGGLVCDTVEYTKILHAILAKTLFMDTTLYDEAERPHTLGVRRSEAYIESTPICPVGTESKGCREDMMPEFGTDMVAGPTVWHFGLSQWVECDTPGCEGGVVRTSSPGAMGAYPWVDRGGFTGYAPHFGVVVRFWPRTGEGLRQIQENVLPLAAAILL